MRYAIDANTQAVGHNTLALDGVTVALKEVLKENQEIKAILEKQIKIQETIALTKTGQKEFYEELMFKFDRILRVQEKPIVTKFFRMDNLKEKNKVK